MPNDPNSTVGPPPFTVLDWIGTIVALAAIAGLALFPISGFRSTFHDLGSSEDLPFLTRVALVPGFPLMLALPAVLSLAMGVRTRVQLRTRRTWIVAAFGLVCLGFALCAVAMYLPIFSLAGKIKAE